MIAGARPEGPVAAMPGERLRGDGRREEARVRGEGVSVAREGQVLGRRGECGGPAGTPGEPCRCLFHRILGRCAVSGAATWAPAAAAPVLRLSSGRLQPGRLGTSAVGTGGAVSRHGAPVSKADPDTLPAGRSQGAPALSFS